MILGIETSTPYISVAILQGDTLLCEVNVDGKGRQPLLLAVEQALLLAGVSRQELDGIAYAKGPGAFTGLRVGLATAKGLAYALKTPLMGISTLLGFAHSLRTQALVAPLLDAKKGEIYGALFGAQGEEVRLSERVASPRVLAEELTAAALGETFFCVGDGFCPIARFLPPQALWFGGFRPRASSVAHLGAQALARGETQSPIEATPTYLRLPEALVKSPKPPFLNTPAKEGVDPIPDPT